LTKPDIPVIVVTFVVLPVEDLVVAVVGVMSEDLHVTTWLRYACVYV